MRLALMLLFVVTVYSNLDFGFLVFSGHWHRWTMKLEIVNSKSEKTICILNDVTGTTRIGDLKVQISQKSSFSPYRQSLRVEPRGKNLDDDETLQALKLPTVNAQLFLRDLGPQISWKTVFLIEYFGPFAIYPLFYARPAFIYGDSVQTAKVHDVVRIACICWSFHYAKRLLETLFVHRFSHATMPLRNVFKNSAYYWGFAAFVAYFVNHPLYTPPCFGKMQIAVGLAGFIIGEVGNFFIHWYFHTIRPEGSKVRKVPMPTGNPFTWLFRFVSCPNYTYEVLSWLSFSVMTQSLPAALFTLAGFFQMTIWALGKHRGYCKEFPSYPRRRKSIVPFVI